MGEFNRLQENEAIATSDVKRCDADFAVITLGSTDGLNEALVALEDAIQGAVATTDWTSITSKPTTLSGYGITDAIDGNGTTNTLPKWNDSNTLIDSKFVDNGTTQAVNTTVSPVIQFKGSTNLPIGVAFYNNHIGASNTSAITGVSQGANTGPDNTGVTGNASGNPTKNVGTFGYAAGASVDNVGLYGLAAGATYNYAAQLQDGTETVIGRFLKNITIDGKANWANITANDVTGVVKTNGTTPLTASWDAGSYTITSNKLVSTTDATANGLTIGKGGGGMIANTALGIDALLSNSSGEFNIAVGRKALNLNTTGGGNVATGASALSKNTTGSNNTSAGNQALEKNTVGSNNTSAGAQALGNNISGNENTAIGYSSIRDNSTGERNTAIGAQSGLYIADGVTSNTNPIQSTFLGAGAKALTTSDTNQLVIGHSAIGNGSNTTTIGNTSTTNFYLHGDMNLKNTSIVQSVSNTSNRYLPITINGVSYKLLLST